MCSLACHRLNHPTPRPASRSPWLQSLEQSFIHYGWLSGLPLRARASALGSQVLHSDSARGSQPSRGTGRCGVSQTEWGFSPASRVRQGCSRTCWDHGLHTLLSVLSVKGNPALSAFSPFRPRIINHVECSIVFISHLVVSDSLWPHGL